MPGFSMYTFSSPDGKKSQGFIWEPFNTDYAAESRQRYERQRVENERWRLEQRSRELERR